jgi:hypothetical protein
MLPSSAIRCRKTRLIALGLASCLASCQIFPPSEPMSAPSLQLRDAIGQEATPIATYGGVGSPSSGGEGALILTQDSLQFRDWNKSGHYESKGLKIPYANIAAVYSHALQLVVIERCDSCKSGYRDYSFNFGLLPREAPQSSAEHTLLSLLDRSDTTHLPSAEMWNMRDRVVAVTSGRGTPEFELSRAGLQQGGISKRAEQGMEIIGGPFAFLAYLGSFTGPGVILALPLILVGGAIGATAGAIVGLGEEMITAQPSSDSEQAPIARRELEAPLKVAPIQIWLQESVMALLLKQGTTANAKENGHLFTRVDDLSAPLPGSGDRVYLPLFQEAIDHVLEVSVQKLRLKTAESKENKEAPEVFFELEGGYRVLSVAQSKKLAGADFECRSTSYPVTAWQAENAKLFGKELHRCVDQLSERITSDFRSRFPDATSLRNQRGSDRIENDSHSTTVDPAK